MYKRQFLSKLQKAFLNSGLWIFFTRLHEDTIISVFISLFKIVPEIFIIYSLFNT